VRYLLSYARKGYRLLIRAQGNQPGQPLNPADCLGLVLAWGGAERAHPAHSDASSLLCSLFLHYGFECEKLIVPGGWVPADEL
jgi:hypothetical protein